MHFDTMHITPKRSRKSVAGLSRFIRLTPASYSGSQGGIMVGSQRNELFADLRSMINKQCGEDFDVVKGNGL